MALTQDNRGHKSVFGIYDSKPSLEGAVEMLKNASFRSSDVSVLMPTQESTKDFANEKSTKAPEGASTGAGVGGAIGGIAGSLIGMGIPEYEAKRYEGFVKDGGILLSVHVDDSDWAKRAKEILENSGARDIASADEKDDSRKEIFLRNDKDTNLRNMF